MTHLGMYSMEYTSHTSPALGCIMCTGQHRQSLISDLEMKAHRMHLSAFTARTDALPLCTSAVPRYTPIHSLAMALLSLIWTPECAPKPNRTEHTGTAKGAAGAQPSKPSDVPRPQQTKPCIHGHLWGRKNESYAMVMRVNECTATPMPTRANPAMSQRVQHPQSKMQVANQVAPRNVAAAAGDSSIDACRGRMSQIRQGAGMERKTSQPFR